MLTNTLYNKHIISIAELSKEELELIINFASKLKQNFKSDLLKNKLIACCFFEPSTRTRLSFESAINRQGGKVIGFADAKNTSVRKGETLADTARIISSYVDAIVMRHHKDGASRVVSKFSSVPIINAGDGTNQHPSQTLLDLLSIFETQKTIENLKVAFVGDLKYGRTVHSLAQALTLFNCEFFFISPQNLAMPDYICEELEEKNIKYNIIDSIEEAIKYADILYMTRIQKERFDEQEFMKIKGDFHIQRSMLKNVKSNFKILHPLPRVDEIHSDVDNTDYAYYFKQARNGLFIRQALLSLILNENIAGII